MRNKSTFLVSINGESIKGENFQEIFANAIFAIGAEKVIGADLERMLISTDRITERSCRFYAEQGYWITSGHGAKRMESLLQRIDRRLPPDTDIRVERKVLERKDTKASKTTENVKNTIAMDTYVVMLHLVSHKQMTFTDIRDLLSWEDFKPDYCSMVLGRIVQTIERLKNEWEEDIPHITVFVFGHDGLCMKEVCDEVSGDKDKQPTPQQIAEYAARITAYPKWNKVLEIFKKEAFETS